MSNKRRKELVDKLRAEGRAAYADGKHIQTCPHQGMNAYQWRKAFREAQEEAERDS